MSKLHQVSKCLEFELKHPLFRQKAGHRSKRPRSENISEYSCNEIYFARIIEINFSEI